MLAGLAMAMSSVTVVGNSILLGRYKPKFAEDRKGQIGYRDRETYSEKDLKEVFLPKA
jgi:hypothetical protein